MGGKKDDGGNYIDKALERAKRRRSPVNFLLFLVKWPFLLALWFLQVRYLHLLFTGVDCGRRFMACLPEGVGTIVFVLAPFFPAVGASMLIANTLMWCIPPVRRILDNEAKAVPGTGFRHAQRQLMTFTAICFAIAWPLMFVAIKLAYR